MLSEQHRGYDSERFIALMDFEGAIAFYGGRTETADAIILIAEADGRPVGFAYLQYEVKNYADLLESAAWLHDLYIDESARGTGAGKKLVEASVTAARELGADKIILHAASRNIHGVEFFEREGFRTTMVEMMLSIGPE
jgi:GNAT superfamily N-acetyltransferase